MEKRGEQKKVEISEGKPERKFCLKKITFPPESPNSLKDIKILASWSEKRFGIKFRTGSEIQSPCLYAADLCGVDAVSGVLFR